MDTENNTILTPDGKFMGLRESSGGLGDCAVFRGIVYAGYRRLALPEAVDYETDNCCPASAGERVCDARHYGCLCPQNLSHLERQIGRDAGLKMEEGKLCLSVTVPCSALHGGERLPVMVWIHGGSYLTGGSEDHRYDVCELSARGNVAVVKISYRLGALGYLWLKDGKLGRAQDAAADSYNGDLPCNLGLEDQKTALKWVRRHISSFGGDPDNITVFGQSAGAHSIASLIASADSLEPLTKYPLYDGEVLFHKAILQSAPLGITITPSGATRVAKRFFHSLASVTGIPAKDIQQAFLDGQIPIDAVLAAQDKVQNLRLGMTFMPVMQDNMPLPAEVEINYFKSKCYATETAYGMDNSVGDISTGKFAVVIGSNRDDASPYARKALGPFWHTPLRDLMTRVLTDKVFRKPMLRYAKSLKGAGIEVFSYAFLWSPKDSSLGCCHSIELPFLLGHYEDWLTAEMLQGMTRKEFIDNRLLFQSLWTEFARTSKGFENVCMGGSPDSLDFVSTKS